MVDPIEFMVFGIREEANCCNASGVGSRQFIDGKDCACCFSY
jgi:hypothetical protein